MQDNSKAGGNDGGLACVNSSGDSTPQDAELSSADTLYGVSGTQDSR